MVAQTIGLRGKSHAKIKPIGKMYLSRLQWFVIKTICHMEHLFIIKDCFSIIIDCFSHITIYLKITEGLIKQTCPT